MGTYRKPAAPRRRAALRPAVVLLGGAVCAAVAGTAPALADDQSFAAPVAHLRADPLGAALLGSPPTDGAPPPGLDLAGIVTQALGLLPPAPAPAQAAEPSDSAPGYTPVADPEPAPQAEQIRIGSIEIDRPSIVAPEQAAQINSGAAEVEDGLSDVLDSSGVDPARSDVIAAQVIGDTVIGAALGGVVIAPVAATVGAAVGGVVGFVFGIPFLPTGLVVGPMVGAATVAALVAVPAVVTGAVIGAGVGAVQGWNAPLDPPAAG